MSLKSNLCKETNKTLTKVCSNRSMCSIQASCRPKYKLHCNLLITTIIDVFSFFLETWDTKFIIAGCVGGVCVMLVLVAMVTYIVRRRSQYQMLEWPDIDDKYHGNS